MTFNDKLKSLKSSSVRFWSSVLSSDPLWTMLLKGFPFLTLSRISVNRYITRLWNPENEKMLNYSLYIWILTQQLRKHKKWRRIYAMFTLVSRTLTFFRHWICRAGGGSAQLWGRSMMTVFSGSGGWTMTVFSGSRSRSRSAQLW